MRNWMTLRGASFAGVPFQVDEEALPKTGRRVAVHEYSKAETHDTEDMGRLPREFRIKAYIANDQADSDVQALIGACSTEGAFSLVLPFFGPQEVRCTGCAPSHKKDRLGFVEIDLEFIEASGDDGASGGFDGAGSFGLLQLGDRIAASALDGLADAVSDAIGAFVPDELAGFVPSL
ncbi:DNA circularization N-terminal domain-containing protein [Methylobacterium sp. A49B]